MLARSRGALSHRFKRLFIWPQPPAPLDEQRIDPGFHLGAAGGVEGLAARRLTDQTMLLGMFIDLLGPLRHLLDEGLGNAPDFEQTPARIKVYLIAKLAQAMGEFVPVNLPAGHLLGIHGAGFEACHRIARLPVGHVEDDDMGVEVGVKFAAGMFGEPRPQQSARRLVDDIARFPLSNGVQKGLCDDSYVGRLTTNEMAGS